MSLFEWYWAPERRSSRVDQALPVIPSEIYLNVIDLLVPPTTLPVDLAPNELNIQVLSSLSRVCRLFANICLPRMYASVELSEPPSRYHNSDPTYKQSLGSVLWTQIAEKQPLALALAQTVKACKVDSLGPWRDMVFIPGLEDTLCAKRSIAVISHMKNICKLEISCCAIYAEHWDIIVELPLLEDLSFYACTFMQEPASTEPKKNPKLKLSRFTVVECVGNQQLLFAAIDPGCLRMLAIDIWAIGKEDWLCESAVTELDLYAFEEGSDEDDNMDYAPELKVALAKVPQSLEVLCISIDETAAYNMNMAADILDSMIQDPAWKDLSSLCSFKLRVAVDGMPELDGLVLDPHLRNFLPRIAYILQDKLGPFATLSNLKHVEYLKKIFRLVDGEWVECLM